MQTSTGDGLTMAIEAGADLVNMDAFYGHCLSISALENDLLWPWPWTDNLVEHGIVVDREGRRRFDEGHGGISVANFIARSQDPLGFCAVIDHAIWQGPCTAGIVPPNPHLLRCNARVFVGEALREVAGKAGISPDGLERTVAAFNQAIESGSGAPQPTPRSGNAHTISTPPFYIAPIVPGITVTMGGPRINRNGQVLRRGGSPIDGLYAVGGTAGGLQGGPNAGYAGGLTAAVVFGLLAAEHVASRSES